MSIRKSRGSFAGWFGRLRQKRKAERAKTRRRAHLETLVKRQLLAVDVSLSGSDLQIVDGASSTDTLTLTTSGSDIVISDSANPITTSIVGSSGSGTQSVTIPLAGVTEISVLAGGGNDSVTFGSNFNPGALDISADGEAGTDSITWASTNTVTSITATSESIALDSNATTTADQSWFGPVVLSGDTTVTSTASGTVRFGTDLDGAFNVVINTAGLTVINNAGRITPLASITTDAPGTTDLSLVFATTGDQTWNDNVDFGDNPSLSGATLTFGGDVYIDSFDLVADMTGTITIGGDISTVTTGSVSLTTERNIVINGSASITTIDGDVTLSANQQAVATTGDFNGIEIAGPITTTKGNVVLTGKGGTSFQNDGLLINAAVSSSGLAPGPGAITIDGEGVATEGAGVRSNAGAIISSVEAPISMTGLSSAEHGWFGTDGQIRSSGTGTDAATITINATTTAGGSKTGAFLDAALITSIDGDVNATFVGNGLAGVLMNSSATFESTGTTADAATITIDADNSDRHGISMQQSSRIRTVDGNVTIDGTSTGGGDGAGFVLNSPGAAIETTGDGNIDLTGTTSAGIGVNLLSGRMESTATGINAGTLTIDGTSTGANQGVLISNTMQVESVDGAIEVIGDGSNSIGVELNQGADIISTGTGANAATITITGNSTSTGFFDDGIRLHHFASEISSVDGDIIIDGTSSNGLGTRTGSNLQIITTGIANLSIDGDGPTDGITLGDGAGIVTITTAGGDVTVTSPDNVDMIVGSSVTTAGGNYTVVADSDTNGAGTYSQAGTVSTEVISLTTVSIPVDDQHIGWTAVGGLSAILPEGGLGGGRTTTKLIDGIGVTGTPQTHLTLQTGGNNGAPHSNVVQRTGGLVIDLGAVYDISLMQIWTWNGTNFPGYKPENFDLYASTDPTAVNNTGSSLIVADLGKFTSIGTDVALNQHTSNDSYEGETFTFGSGVTVPAAYGDESGIVDNLSSQTLTARYIFLDDMDGSNDFGGRLGLAEIQFAATTSGDVSASADEIVLGGSTIAQDVTYATGVIAPFGDLNLSGNLTSNSVDVPSNVTVETGVTFGGIGSISGDVTVQSGGTFAPGNSPGILNTANFELQMGSTLEIELGGTSPGNTATDHDQVNVTGSVTLVGDLDLQLFGAFTPTTGDSFVIINNDGTDDVTGTFNGIDEGGIVSDDSGNLYTITYEGGSGTNDVVLTWLGETFVVTTTADSGNGSLRSAIADSNAGVGQDRIEFDIPSAGTHVIELLTALPNINDGVTIDGTSEPDFVSTPVVQLTRDLGAPDITGLTFVGGSENSTLRGLSVTGFTGVNRAGVLIGANDVTVAGNYIGLDTTGAVDANDDGIRLQAANGIIGGTSASDRNVISGNVFNGIRIDQSGAINNRVFGNYIGTNTSGTAPIANATGVFINVTASNNFIGTDGDGSNDADEGNLISGNSGAGVFVFRGVAGDAVGNVIAGNLIGTNAAGTGDVANATGVGIDSVSGTIIGGDTDEERNVISGNGTGVSIIGAQAVGSVVEGNYIGVDVGGNAGLGNTGDGISVSSNSPTIRDNVVSDNGNDGIQLTGVGNGIDASALAWFKGESDATDAVGNNDGTLQGGVAYAAGTSGQAFDFNGIDGYVEIPDSVSLDRPTVTNELTIEAWINWDGTPQPNGNPIARKTVSPFVDPFSVYGFTVGNDGRVGSVLSDGVTPGGASFAETASGLITAGIDHHVAATYDGAFQRIYVDGELVREKAVTISIGNSSGPLVIGSDSTPGGNFFDGRIDELAVYDTALSSTDIAAIHAMNGTGKQGAVLEGNYIGTTPETDSAVTPSTVTSTEGNTSVPTNSAFRVQQVIDASEFSGAGFITGIRFRPDGVSGSAFTSSFADYRVELATTSAAPDSLSTAFADNIGFDTTEVFDGVWNPSSSFTGPGGGPKDFDVVLDFDTPFYFDPSGGNLLFDEVSFSGPSAAYTLDYHDVFGDTTQTIASSNASSLTGVEIAPLVMEFVFIPDVGNTGIGIDINDSPGNVIGGDTTGQRNVVSGNDFVGINVTGAASEFNTVQGNYVGTDDSGTADFGNNVTGIVVAGNASGNLIGGDRIAGEGNVVSGNDSSGIAIGFSSTAGTDNIVQGNYVGLDESGLLPLGNGDGITIAEGASSGNQIGGIGTGEGNFIAGNSGRGIVISSTGADNNLIQANVLGLGINQANLRRNSGDGIVIEGGASNNIIGGSLAGQNIISASGGSGVVITGSGTSGNLVQSNIIGSNSGGTADFGNLVDGVQIIDNAAGNTIGGEIFVTGNIISGNTRHGVYINGIGNQVQGNFIGVDSTGGTALPNLSGVVIEGALNRIGVSTLTTEGNLISGNTNHGVLFSGENADGNILAGNLIGTDQNGTGPLGNQQNGVLIQSGPDNNYIGTNNDNTNDSIEGNFIAGNGVSGTFDGVLVTGSLTDNNRIWGNFVGIDFNGTDAIANTRDGIRVSNGPTNTNIGGADPDQQNVIGGNASSGVHLLGATTTGTVVLGNIIGTNASASSTLGNSASGISITAGANGNTIGDITGAAGNVIAGNAVMGIAMNSADGNFIYGNTIGDPSIGAQINGIELQSSDNNVIGVALSSSNTITAATSNGVFLSSSDGNQILNNSIVDNSGTGISLSASANNDIGAVSDGGNIITGNVTGVHLQQAATQTNRVFNNTITGNTGNGVLVNVGASSNFIGTDGNLSNDSDEGNLISDNNLSGILLSGVGTTNNTVAGNLIGLNSLGNAPLGNTGAGITITDASGNTIGGDITDERNVISANGGVGISVNANGLSNTLLDNFIGTDIGGALPIVGQTTEIDVVDGTVFVNGTVEALEGVEVAATGVLGGTGTINGEVVSAGTIAPGNSPGVLNTGDITFSDNSSFEVELGGTTPGNSATNHDQIVVTGSVTIGNNVTLDLSLFGEFAPDSSDTFVIIDNDLGDGVTGEFAGLADDSSFTSDGVTYTIDYDGGDGNDVVLTAQFTTFVVTNTTDSLAGSLREAITQANAVSGTDRIVFDIFGAGPHTITPLTTLPTITEAVTIDGYSQSGASENTLAVGNDAVIEIVVDGTTASGVGINLAATASTVRGLSVVDWQWGIQTSSGTIEGNFIGVLPDGVTAGANTIAGVFADNSNGVLIGTDGDGVGDFGERNLISGNKSGVLFQGAFTSGAVAGNYIGTTRTGTAPLPNAEGMFSGAARVGTDGSDDEFNENERNVISGNTNEGILSDGAAVIAGNYIGVDATGTVALANGGGIQVGGDGALIGTNADGTADSEERNVISGNTGSAIFFVASDGATVAGNLIGTDVTGTLELGNANGIATFQSAENHQIGGPLNVQRNIIAGNSGSGLVVEGSRWVIENNYIGLDINGTDTTIGGIGNGIGINVVGRSPLIVDNVISNNDGNAIAISGDGDGIDASAIAWFKAEGDATDSVGDNDGTPGGALSYTAGVSGQAFDFNGVDTRVLIADNPSLDRPSITNQVTIESWVTWDGDVANPQSFSHPIVRKTVSPLVAPFAVYGLDVLKDGRLGFQVSNGVNSAGSSYAITSTAISPGVNYHIAATYDGAAQRIYLDGELILERNATVTIGDSAGELTIGRDSQFGGNKFDGQIDELAIYDTALSPIAIAAIVAMNGVGKQGAVIQGNLIGLNADGDDTFGNAGAGIFVTDSIGNVIGGDNSLKRNVIAGNDQGGVTLQNGSDHNQISGNYIGVDTSGDSIGTQLSGLDIAASAGNLIGGGAGEGNLIIGHTNDGVKIAGSTSIGNRISGNTISDNGLIGVFVDGSPSTTIGTDGDGIEDAFESNTIDGNQHGIEVGGAVSTGSLIAGNLIGLGGANGDGIRLVSGSSQTTVGGDSIAERNVVSGNTGVGVLINGSDENTVIGNYIGTDALGATAVQNSFGIRVFTSSDNVIGTGLPGEGNVVVGPGENALVLQNSVFDNTVQGNIVGWDVSGTTGLGGELKVVSGSGNIIGTDGDGTNDATEGNLIHTGRFQSAGNVLAGNWVGVMSDGVTGGGGSFLLDAGGNVLGTDGDGVSDDLERNVFRGIWVRNTSIVPNEIVGNYIGTNEDGDAGLINGGFGIRSTNSDGATLVKDNVISGVVSVGVGLSATRGIPYRAEAWFEAEDATDSIGTNDATLQGTATLAAGLDGNAFSLDGISGYVSVPTSTDLDLSADEFSIEGWINPTLSGDGNLHTIIDRSNDNGTVDYRLAIHTDGRLRVDVGDLNNTVFSTDTIPVGQWTHVAATQNTDSGEIRLYIDGRVVGTGVAGTSNTSTQNLLIGARNDQFGISTEIEFFAGLIDDIGIYSRSLDAAEILGIANAQGVNKQGGLLVGNQIGIGTDGSSIGNGGGTGWHAGASIGGSAAVIGGEDPSLRNIISGNNPNNLLLRGGSGSHVVAGNHIGVGEDGKTPVPASPFTVGIGVLDGSNNNIIGGSRALGNVISGNVRGITITSADNTTIAGNLIGTDMTGTIGVPNSSVFGSAAGIDISSAATNVTIGSNGDGINDANEFNVISGNTGRAIDTESASVVINGNFIGTDITGTVPLGNQGTGVRIHGGSTSVGAVGLGNVIGANTLGVSVENGATATVQGNWIGASKSGTIDLANAGAGIEVAGNAVIGGGAVGEGNTVAFNGAGVVVTGTSSVATIRGNQIYDNVGLGIDLNDDGVTLNDPLDVDGGANASQNFPTVGAVSTGSTTSVTGTFAAQANSNYTLDFYANTSLDGSGFGEGARYLGSQPVSTDASGASLYTALGLGTAFVGEFITATATDAAGNTSEFSQGTIATSSAPPTIVANSLLVTEVEQDSEEETFGLPTLVVLEGQELNLTGDFADADPSVSVVINWGDASSDNAQIIRSESFASSHIYADDDPSSSPSDQYGIFVTATDLDGSGSALLNVTVVNVDPTITNENTSLSSTVIDEGDSITLSGEFVDPGVLDQHTLRVDWGDGSPIETVTITEGARNFAATHPYSDSGLYKIQYSVFDDDRDAGLPQPGEVGFEFDFSKTVEVLNVAPTALISVQSNATEGDMVPITAVASDTGSASLSFEWVIRVGSREVFASNEASFDFVPSEPGIHQIDLLVGDGSLETSVTSSFDVANAIPMFDPEDLQIRVGGTLVDGVFEGDTLTLEGIFEDRSPTDVHVITVDFGDGSLPQTRTSRFGSRRFSGFSHTYVDNPASGTTYDVSITIDDGKDSTTTMTPLTVSNAVPRIDFNNDLVTTTQLDFSAQVNDPGILDTHAFEWFVDGVLTSETPQLQTPRPQNDTFDVLLRVTDKDGGVAEINSLVVVPTNLDNPNVVTVTSEASGDISIEIDGATPEIQPRPEKLFLLTGDSNDVAQFVTASGADPIDVVVDSGAGDDMVTTSGGDDKLIGGPGADTLNAGAGDDELFSDEGDDVLIGADGDDLYRFKFFSDKELVDSQGDDTLTFEDVPVGTGVVNGITLNLGTVGTQQQVYENGSVVGNVTLNGSFENVIGSAHKDALTGNASANNLFGGDGDDSIVANGGDDTLNGGDGNDTIDGGSGSSDSIFGGSGDDSIEAGGGGDEIDGGEGNDTIVGGSDGDDSIFGGSGDDSISGGMGDEEIDGGDGNDTITSGGSDDSIFGGDGDDSIVGGGSDDTIDGGDGNDSIFGGSGDNESITGGTGDDTISGGGGSGDSIFGGPGDDSISGNGDETLDGGTGNDTITGSGSNDSIFGGDGDDSITGGDGQDTIDGGDGNDIIVGSGGDGDSIFGGTGDDSIEGGLGDETLEGGSGNDTIVGGSDDSVFGGSGDDSITGEGGDTLVGGSGDDSIFGGGDNESIDGGSGDDLIDGSAGDNDSIFGGSGDDSITGGGNNDTIDGGDGDDVIDGGVGTNDSVFGGDGDDSIDGGGGSDTVDGGAGDDSIVGGGTGSDSIFGGSGDDSITGGGGTGQDTIDGGDGSDTIIGGTGEDDSIFGGDGDDSITGGGGGDDVDGGAGDDTIVGGGNDSIFGGDGDDSITGGGDNDSLHGGDGDDSIFGGSGDNESINGGDGDDTIVSGGGTDDSIFGGDGDDSISGGGEDSDTLDGGAGDDTIVGGDGGNDSVFGGDGDDSIEGGGGLDTIDGGNGDDEIEGGSGNDSIFGGDGDDSIESGGGQDTIDGGGGDDSIFGGSGDNESISGGDGEDTIASGGGTNDSIFGGGGDDVLIADGDAVKVFGNTKIPTGTLGNDRVVVEADADISIATVSGKANVTIGSAIVAVVTDVNQATLIGGAGDNTLDASGFVGDVRLLGLDGNDTLRGGVGDDWIEGGLGNDVLDGAGGNNTYFFAGSEDLGMDQVIESVSTSNDTLDFFGLGQAVDVNLDNPTVQQVSQGLIAIDLTNANTIENVTGTVFSDKLFGNGQDNVLVGGGGLDHLSGGAGNDYLTAARTRLVYLDFDSETSGDDHVYTPTERAAIEARMKADFAAFDVEISQTRPTEGVYVTVLFNAKPTVGGREVSGGVADRIGFRDVVRGGLVLVDVNNFLGTGNNQLPPSEQNFIAMSSTIGSHELGHVYGLRHQDAFGTPGDGIFAGVRNSSSRSFLPNYDGPANAGETSNHLIASPASIRTTLADALADPYFGEREAFKLAFGETGTSVFESANVDKTDSLTVGNTTYAVQQLGDLTPISVPNTIQNPNATNFGAVLDAAAANVLGDIELDGTTSENDFYSFNATAGDVITVEVFSFSLRTRISNLIDSLIRVYDSSGTKLDYYGNPLGAFNDDGFEPTDSVLVDLVIPSTGTYYVEVDTFYFFNEEFSQYVPDFDAVAFCDGRVGDIRCEDTDTGEYELLIYRVGAGSNTPEGDLLVGGDGQDTLVGSSGADTFLTDGNDIFDGPEVGPAIGAENVVTNQPPLLPTGQLFVVNEEDTLTFTAQAFDPDESAGDSLTYSLRPISGKDYPVGASIDPETGVFTWTPADDGEFDVEVVATDLTGLTASQPISIVVNDIDLSISITAITGTLGEGTLVTVESLAVDPLGTGGAITYNYEVIEGTNVIETLSGVGLTSFSFEPADEGNLQVRVTASASVSGQTAVAQQTITITNDVPVANAGPDQTVYEGNVVSLDGSFTDDGTLDTHTFLWTVTASNGQVVADVTTEDFSFTPLDDGTYTLELTVTDNAGDSTSDTTIITVNNQLPVFEAGPDETILAPAQGVFTRTISFTDLGADIWTATVDYDDGLGAQPVAVDQLNKSLVLNHVYATNGVYTVTVTISDGDGPDVSDSFVLDVTVSVPPVITSFTGPNSAVAGQTLTYNVVTDGVNDTITWIATDAQGATLASGSGSPFDYQPTTDGTQTLIVTATNVYGQATSASMAINVTRIGIVGNDLYIAGTQGDDILQVYRNGNHKLFVYDGHALMGSYQGVTGDIVVHAFDGDDAVYISKNIDHDAKIFGGDGRDWIIGGRGNDHIDGGSGRDWINGRNGHDVLFGADQADVLFGGNGDDWIDGGAGDDWLFGDNGADTLIGGSGDDVLFGGRGRDLLLGMEGDDILLGQQGNDTLDGGPGSDLVFQGNPWWLC